MLPGRIQISGKTHCASQSAWLPSQPPRLTQLAFRPRTEQSRFIKTLANFPNHPPSANMATTPTPSANMASPPTPTPSANMAWKVFWTLVLLILNFLVVCAPFQVIWPLAVMELLGVLFLGMGWASRKVREWGAPANEANQADHGLTEVVVEP